MRGTTLRMALGVVALTGFLHGLWTDRWGSSSSRLLETAATRLDQVPLQLGQWEGESQEISDRERRLASIVGCARRWYWNREAGEAGPRVWISLVCGRPQDIGAHSPDVCYAGAGFRILGEVQRRSISPPQPSTQGTFWVANFRAPVQGGRVRVWWAWTTGETWEAPDLPRWTYARARLLYKLTVTEERRPGVTTSSSDSGEEFLYDLLPKVQRLLIDENTPQHETFRKGIPPPLNPL